MNMNTYTISLSNGLVISDLMKESYNFVSKTEIMPEMFKGGLESVRISNGDIDHTYNDMTLVHVTKIGDLWYFELIQVIVPEEKTYTVTLSNGTVIPDLKMNGNNFISKTEITPSMFDSVMDYVIINDGDYDEKLLNVELGHLEKQGDEWWFVLSEIPQNVMEQSKLRADVDFLAMMADIEL